MAVTTSGKIYSWGSGQNGQLGLGNSEPIQSSPIYEPTLIQSLESYKVNDIMCGESNSIAFTETGKIYGWGQGVARSPNLIKSLKEMSPNKNRFDQEPQLDVISFYPKELSHINSIHPFLLTSDI